MTSIDTKSGQSQRIRRQQKLKAKVKTRYLVGDALGVFFVTIIFIVPFVFILLNALMSRQEANLLNFALPSAIYWDNFVFVFEANNFQILRAFRNSGIIVVGGVLLSILAGSMAGYVIQRRKDKAMSILNSVLLIGLMVPPTIMPTIWVLEILNLQRSLLGLIFIQVALQLPFTTMLYRGFMGSVPEELEEAGYIDGCSRWRLFFFIVFPLLKPVTATVTILNAVHFFNDFMNPLFFLPGAENITVQLTLFHFMGQFGTSFNLLFANALIITIPMLILFIFFNRKIVDGMVAGAVKG